MSSREKKLLIVLALVIGVGAVGYFGYQLIQEKITLENQLSQTRADFTSAIKNLEAINNSLRQELASTTAERNDFEQKFLNQVGRLNLLNEQVRDIQSTVSMLEKLRQTDPELLKKYSKVYFLNENYVPKSLIKIDYQYTVEPKNDYLFLFGALPFLQGLMEQAKTDNIDLKINSAYRSFGTQAEIKTIYKMTYGSGANSFVADQGYSEHQLGTTVDFTTLQTFPSFDKAPAYQWLRDNAYKYGFILSYPEGNQYYQFEPWHWRFVGRDLAAFLHEQGKNFYDLDQRVIDQYLISFFD